MFAQALISQKNVKNFLVNRPILSGRIKMSCMLLIRHTLSIRSKKSEIANKKKTDKTDVKIVSYRREATCLFAVCSALI